MNEPTDSREIASFRQALIDLIAHLQIEADFVVERGVVTRGQRIVIRDLLQQAHAEIKRLQDEVADCPICPMVATDRDDALNDFQSLAESYDALVANSSAEHQRISDLLQALSANVIRLDEEKEQDRHTIEYWKGQYEQASERVHDLECHALEIVEHAREQDARLKDLEGAVSAPMPLDRNMWRLRTMFGIEPGTPDSETFTIIERYDAANLRTIDSLRDHVAMHARLGQLAHQQAERWQGMAEDLWEELQEWHTENCGQDDHGTPIGAPCTCHGILAAKWDEITHADDWTDDEADS